MTQLIIKSDKGEEVILAQIDDNYKTTINSSLSDYADRGLSQKLWEAAEALVWHANKSSDPKYVMKPALSWSEFGFKKGDGR